MEAREPCSVFMYVDVRPKAQQDSRPSPTQWHWSLMNTAPQTPLTWIPDAVLVTCMVWIVATPEIAMNLEVDGKLIFCAFGEHSAEWPIDGQEPHGQGNRSYIQDLSWLLIGWLHAKNPAALPDWYDSEAEFISYKDRTTGQVLPCTHQCNYKTFYSAWHRISQDSVTGELGTKISAVQEYAASKRRVAQAETNVSS